MFQIEGRKRDVEWTVELTKQNTPIKVCIDVQSIPLPETETFCSNIFFPRF